MRETDPTPDQILRKLINADDQAVAPRKSAKKEQGVVDHTTRPVLMERAAYLKKMARAGEGSASEVLKAYPRHNVQLSVRLRSGVAEFHEHFADLFIVLDGRATLVTGGAIVEPERVGPGEIRGSIIADGNPQELHAGDVAHVPAGTPHQVLLRGDATFTAMVIKIQEND